MPSTTWYFDFVSPYAYLGWRGLSRLPAGTVQRFRPVLFAALLNHWGQKGPAEVAPKRLWTHRSCVWWARRHGVPFRMPAAHPFNSLSYLRLAVAAGCAADAIDAIFTALWTTGADPRDPAILAGLTDALGIRPERLEDERCKSSLREMTGEAIRQGVFGVPTLLIDGEIFFGGDSLDFAADFLADPRLFEDPEMQRVAALPIGAQRPGIA